VKAEDFRVGPAVMVPEISADIVEDRL